MTKPPPYLNNIKWDCESYIVIVFSTKMTIFVCCFLLSLLPSFHFCAVCCCCCYFSKLLVSRRQLIERPWLGARDRDHPNTKPSAQNALGEPLWRWGKGRDRGAWFSTSHAPLPSRISLSALSKVSVFKGCCWSPHGIWLMAPYVSRNQIIARIHSWNTAGLARARIYRFLLLYIRPGLPGINFQ